MTVLLFVVATATLYFLLFRFAVSRVHGRPAKAAEQPPEPRSDAVESTEETAWTALDDRQLDRLLRESSP